MSRITVLILKGIRCGLLLAFAGFWIGGSAVAGPPTKTDVLAPFGCMGAACIDVGDAMLVRTPNGVKMNIWTSGLDVSAVYTVWWVIFNNPDACVDGCNGPDLGIPAVDGCVQWATGHPIGGTDTGNFSAHLQEGDTSSFQNFPCSGLVDSSVAEIHLVVHSHGPIIPQLIYEQMSTFSGGCPPNTCVSQQFAVFLP